LAVLLAPALAAGSPQDVIDDYRDDGLISAGHSVADLHGSLQLAVGERGYGAFSDAVTLAIEDAALGGRTPSGGNEQRSQEIVVGGDGGDLPSPPGASPEGGLPWVLPVMAVLAGLLLLTGMGSAAYRRFSPPRR
jgi:hypothetical protein